MEIFVDVQSTERCSILLGNQIMSAYATPIICIICAHTDWSHSKALHNIMYALNLFDNKSSQILTHRTIQDTYSELLTLKFGSVIQDGTITTMVWM